MPRCMKIGKKYTIALTIYSIQIHQDFYRKFLKHDISSRHKTAVNLIIRLAVVLTDAFDWFKKQLIFEARRTTTNGAGSYSFSTAGLKLSLY